MSKKGFELLDYLCDLFDSLSLMKMVSDESVWRIYYSDSNENYSY